MDKVQLGLREEWKTILELCKMFWFFYTYFYNLKLQN